MGRHGGKSDLKKLGMESHSIRLYPDECAKWEWIAMERRETLSECLAKLIHEEAKRRGMDNAL